MASLVTSFTILTNKLNVPALRIDFSVTLNKCAFAVQTICSNSNGKLFRKPSTFWIKLIEAWQISWCEDEEENIEARCCRRVFKYSSNRSEERRTREQVRKGLSM